MLLDVSELLEAIADCDSLFDDADNLDRLRVMFEELRDSLRLEDFRIKDSGEPSVDDLRLPSDAVIDDVVFEFSASSACTEEDSSFEETRSNGDFDFVDCCCDRI